MPTPTPVYSTLISCLHDEPEPVGKLGQGTHYSVFRSTEWLDVDRKRLDIPEVHDFAVIWDEDHDTRIVAVVEDIYMAGLLSPIQFIGERKGTLTVIVASKFYYSQNDEELEAYTRQLSRISHEANHGDCWGVEVGMFDRSPVMRLPYSSRELHHQCEVKNLVRADEERVIVYLKTIDLLWSLGTKPFVFTLRPQRFAPTAPPWSAPGTGGTFPRSG